jgi:hypothetical protein
VSYLDKDISSWDRKDIIGQLISELEFKIKNFSASQYMNLFYTLNSNLSRKNILFYFKNDYAQGLVENLNWAGDIKQTDSDYLMIVDANLAALKTDAVISRKAKYFLSEDKNNYYQAKLQLNYSHTGKKADWRTSRYQSYTRVYLPEGAYDIEAKGFSSDLDIYDDKLLAKKVIGAYLLVDIFQSKEIEISYKLPKNDFLTKKSYELYFQKQPGTNWELELAIDLADNLELKKISPNLSAQVISSTNNIYWDLSLDTDKIFKINF